MGKRSTIVSGVILTLFLAGCFCCYLPYLLLAEGQSILPFLKEWLWWPFQSVWDSVRGMWEPDEYWICQGWIVVIMMVVIVFETNQWLKRR